jgi:hypothetical protein
MSLLDNGLLFDDDYVRPNGRDRASKDTPTWTEIEDKLLEYVLPSETILLQGRYCAPCSLS